MMIKGLSLSLIPVINFASGIAFFLAGFIITFQFAKLFKNSYKHIKFIGIFFVLQGLAAWVVAYYSTCPEYISKLLTIDILLNTLSYYFLLVYGVNMQLLLHNKKGIIKHLPKLVFFSWIALVCVLSFSDGGNSWQRNADITLRYFFAFPGALLTGLALKTKMLEIKDNFEINLGKYMQRTYIAFFVYAFATGIIVPEGHFLIANIVNKTTFLNLFGVPIEYVSGICGIIIAYSTVIILQIFYIDHFKKIEIAEKESTILAERERISQDIHDGTMQALYGVGLRLQYIESLLKAENDQVVKEQLHYAMLKLNETSQEIRAYITDLRPNRKNIKLITEINDIIRDFISETNIPLRFNYEQSNENVIIKEQIIAQIVFIINEILNNVRKHASASLVKLTVRVGKDKLEISIEDDGIGFDDKKEGMVGKGIGLKSINKRIFELNGSLNITSIKNVGTSIVFNIPLEDK